MEEIIKLVRVTIGRRKALLGLFGMLAGSLLLRAQHDPPSPGGLLKDYARPMTIDEMVTACDFEPVFFSNVPRVYYDYVAHGADSEFTMRRNREAFGWVDI